MLIKKTKKKKEKNTHFVQEHKCRWIYRGRTYLNLPSCAYSFLRTYPVNTHTPSGMYQRTLWNSDEMHVYTPSKYSLVHADPKASERRQRPLEYAGFAARAKSPLPALGRPARRGRIRPVCVGRRRRVCRGRRGRVCRGRRWRVCKGRRRGWLLPSSWWPCPDPSPRTRKSIPDERTENALVAKSTKRFCYLGRV